MGDDSAFSIQHSALNLEVEVKFLAGDLTAVRQKLLDVGAVVKAPRVLERNAVLDTADNELYAHDKLLRLRRDTAVTLTFKGQVAEDALSEAKVREELEVKVDDFDTAVLILNRLGYFPRKTYEKQRETFRLGDVEVTLDEMPYGDFVELEGPEAAIKAAAAALGLDWNQRLLTNYLALMDKVKAYYNLPFDDVTFDNFRGLTISVADVLGGAF